MAYTLALALVLPAIGGCPSSVHLQRQTPGPGLHLYLLNLALADVFAMLVVLTLPLLFTYCLGSGPQPLPGHCLLRG